MAILKLNVTYLTGEEVLVVPTLGDTLNFERTLKNNPRWGTLQENALKMQPFRAWSALKRNGGTEATWEDWAESVADVTAAGDEDGEDDLDALGKDTRTTQPTI